MVTIIFEAHATSEDNEARLASGWYDSGLSPLGVTQARELGRRYAGSSFDVIFCSDLQRSYKTAELAFGNIRPIIRDKRLRECNYGRLDHFPKAKIDGLKAASISKPFPGGESYEDATKRIKLFLADLLKNYDGQKVMVIGHRATQYGLEQWIAGKPLPRIVLAPWHWQPGWAYELTALNEATAAAA